MQEYKLRCITCKRVYKFDEVDYVCPKCGYTYGTLEVIYDYDNIKKMDLKSKLKKNLDFRMWRYLDLLPVFDKSYIQPLRVGYTPLYSFDSLAEEFSIKDFYIKDDGLNPSASYKDRASALAVLKAQEFKKEVIACASTGNAASSLAAFSASTALKTYIFVPYTAPEAKIAQLMIYGAKIFKVKGDYDKAYDLAIEVSDKYNFYNRSAAINPYLVEGKKTGALEVAEQLNWQVPTVVFVPVGDGSVISGIIKGFKELYELNLIESIPKIIGVQSENASSVYKTYQNYIKTGNLSPIYLKANTVADSISVGKPRDVVKAVRYLKEVNGEVILVKDSEILNAIKELSVKTGVFSEPAGATAYAGFIKYLNSGKLSNDDRVVIFITGNGLKDIKAVEKIVENPYVVNDFSDVNKILQEEIR